MRRWLVALALASLLGGCSSREEARGATDAGMDAGGAAVDAGRTDGGGPEDGGGSGDAGASGDSGASADGGGLDGGGLDGGGASDAGHDAGGPSDAGFDAGNDGGDRTVVTEACARRFGTCTSDLDCAPSGCGGETCASADIASTCDCVAPSASCGCVAGSCAWYR